MKPYEFAERLDGYARGTIPASEFEEWFDQESWNVHQLGNQRLANAVSRVESLLTAYDDDRLSEEDYRQRLRELAKAIRPFAHDHIQMWRFDKDVPFSLRYSLGSPISPVQFAHLA